MYSLCLTRPHNLAHDLEELEVDEEEADEEEEERKCKFGTPLGPHAISWRVNLLSAFSSPIPLLSFLITLYEHI